MASSVWISGRNGDWADPSNWEDGTVPTASDTVDIPGGSPTVTAPISVASISNEGDLAFEVAGTCKVAGNIVNTGTNHNFDVIGTTLQIGGRLSNGDSDFMTMSASTGANQHATQVYATAVSNAGVLMLRGGATPDVRTTLNVDGPASFGNQRSISGLVDLEGHASINFTGSAQFVTIARNSELDLDGADAFVTDAALGLDSNSALQGLHAVKGTLALNAGAEIDTANALTFGPDGQLFLEGGMLAVGGTLRNSGSIFGENDTNGMLHISGGTVNNGTMSFQKDLAEFDGALTGSGTVYAERDATLDLKGYVGRDQLFYLTDGGTLEFAAPEKFHGTVEHFKHSASYLFDAFDSSTTFNFVESLDRQGGFLNVSDGANGSAHIYMRGIYHNNDFNLTVVDGGVKLTHPP